MHSSFKSFLIPLVAIIDLTEAQILSLQGEHRETVVEDIDSVENFWIKVPEGE